MDYSTRADIVQITRYAIPIVGAIAGVALMEYFDAGQSFRDCELAKAEITRHFYGNFLASLNIASAHMGRFVPDGVGLVLGTLVGLSSADSLERKLLNPHHYGYSKFITKK